MPSSGIPPPSASVHSPAQKLSKRHVQQFLWKFIKEACVHAQSLSCVRLFVTPWTTAHQAPLSMEFSRQEYWSGLPFSSPRGLPGWEIKPISPTFPVLAGRSLPLSHLGSPLLRRHNWANHWPLVIELNLQLLSLVRWWPESSNPLMASSSG